LKDDITNIDLRLLRCFDALMTERNVSRAAHLVSTSQPAMSVALGKLRALFNDGALKNQVQHFSERMLHGKNLQSIEY
jgi:LysR family transcriptional activator for leuABCD operon